MKNRAALLLLLGRLLGAEKEKTQARAAEYGGPGSSGRGRRPSAFVLSALLLVLLITNALSRNAVFSLGALAVLLLRTAILPLDGVKRVVLRVLGGAAMTAVFALPSLFLGSPASFLRLLLKAFVSLTAVFLLNEDVSWKELRGVLHSLRLPSAFLFTMDQTVRFLTLLGRRCVTMTEAMVLRAGDEKPAREKSAYLGTLSGTGGILGTAFLQSEKMAQGTAEAMLLRGFDGGHVRIVKYKISRKDAAGAILGAALLLAVFVLTQRML